MLNYFTVPLIIVFSFITIYYIFCIIKGLSYDKCFFRDQMDMLNLHLFVSGILTAVCLFKSFDSMLPAIIVITITFSIPSFYELLIEKISEQKIKNS